MCAALLDADQSEPTEFGSVTFKEQGRSVPNIKRMTEDHPDIVAQYMGETRFRVLRFQKAKK